MKTFFKYVLTGLVVLAAVALVLFKYWDRVVNPWTRDGQVRADVIQVTARVSGPIVHLAVKDNQFVKAGDLLFEIDPRTFQAALDQARAGYDKIGDTYLAQEKQVDAAKAQVDSSLAQVVHAQSTIKVIDSQIEKDRSEHQRQRELLPKRATSQRAVDRAKSSYEISMEKRKGALASLSQARAALEKAKASLAQAQASFGAVGDANASVRQARATVRQAELNLEFTRILAPVDGYVTNLNLRLGSHAVANQPVLALVDVNSFWVHGFFKETSVGRIGKGDKAVVTLMGYPKAPIDGHVDSIGWGIAQKDGSTGYNLLPNVNPTFQWIRLAQRVPVRIHLEKVPEGVELRVGTTASVMVMTDSDAVQKSNPSAPDAGKHQ